MMILINSLEVSHVMVIPSFVHNVIANVKLSKLLKQKADLVLLFPQAIQSAECVCLADGGQKQYCVSATAVQRDLQLTGGLSLSTLQRYQPIGPLLASQQ
jgi:hypothetical protein